ncbi:tetratricopeptide repeat protein [Thermoflavimicrobium daqui]|jgi:tetratricopeptide (TPR) repeat protein|uniref:J domain-containing protein n=1 Tax=Thermoflavimicrobium daqui TaxID=2137476 RepID=A0A364K313_9BACL|nr:tetratricopeptide repeat protein [Thermoflavimicrobium daqui]RAL23203.1 hypothetical protein DL897_12620 [Thermoflavimicrobium daqui]
MQNYYQLLNISPSAKKAEIQKVINTELRRWTQRTNSPQFEKRQEAERMVRKLEEIEKILLDDEKRSKYDEQLESADLSPNQTSQSTPESSTEKSNLAPQNIRQQIAQGWQYLEQGRTFDALFLARKVVEQMPDNPEVWALLAYARFQNGEKQEAIQAMTRACSLDSSRADYFIFLGDVYRSFQRLDQAEKHYHRAIELNHKDIMVQYKLGLLFLELKQYQRAIDTFEKCLQVSPRNPEVERELARAYIELATIDWILIPKGHVYLSEGIYPVGQNLNLAKAESYLERASRLSFNDPELRKKLHLAKKNLGEIKGRKFTGSWVWAIASVVMFWLVIWIKYLMDGTPYNEQLDNMIAMFLEPVLYIISAFSPRLRYIQEAVKRKSPRTDFAYLFDWLRERTGMGAYIFTGLLMVLCIPIVNFILPIVIVYNFYKNYFKYWKQRV